MLIIPLYFFLIIFLIAFLIIAVFYIISVSHIFTTANLTLASFLITFIVFTLAVATLFGTWFLLQGTDWQQSVKIFDSAWLGVSNKFIELIQ